MEMSPRQMLAWLHYCEIIDRSEKANALTLATLAARGKEEDVKRQLRELTATDDHVVRVRPEKPVFPPGARVKRKKNG